MRFFLKIYIRDTRRYVLPKSIDLCIPLRSSTTTHHSRKSYKQKSVYATFPTDEFSTKWKIWHDSTFTLNLALFARNRRDRLNFNFCQWFYQLPMGRALLKNGALLKSKWPSLNGDSTHPCNLTLTVQKFPTPELQREWVQGLGVTIIGIVWMTSINYLWLVDGIQGKH